MKQQRSDKVLLIAGAIVIIALLAGLVHMFILRFQSGDIYPPYSSLRYDPLGTRAYYDALASCEGVTVERSFKPVEQLGLDADTALFFLGDRVFTLSNEERMPKDIAAFVNSFVRKGGRVVITLLPRNVGKPSEIVKALTEDQEDEDSTLKKKKKGTQKKVEKKEPEPDSGTDVKDKEPDGKDTTDRKLKARNRKSREYRKYMDETIAVSKWLGVEFIDHPLDSSEYALRDQSCGLTNLPQSLSCHTSLCLTNVSTNWTVLYRREESPVIAELKIGKGTLVLSTLTYFVSNEAMRDERQPALLAWLAGDRKRIVFDEQHFGIAEQVGIAVLARRYHLEWFAGAALILALLFIWQRMTSIVPAAEAGAGGAAADLALGKDSASGLVNLLRRSIAGSNILDVCFSEWRKSHRAGDKRAQAKTGAMESIIMNRRDQNGKTRKPAEIYNEMCEVLKKND